VAVSDLDPLTVSAAEAALMLGVSDDVIYQLLDRRVLPELPRWNRRRLIPRRAVELIVERAMADFDPDAVLAAVG